MLPGGRINYFEDSLNAIKREIKEELGYNLDFKFSSLQEIFIKKENKQIMQYCFCYKSIYKEEIKEEIFKSLDDENQYFYWVDIDKLNSYNIIPKSNLKLINKDINHIIDKENDYE